MGSGIEIKELWSIIEYAQTAITINSNCSKLPVEHSF